MKEIGADHPDTLLSQHQLALVVYTQGLWKHNDNHIYKLTESFELLNVCVYAIM